MDAAPDIPTDRHRDMILAGHQLDGAELAALNAGGKVYLRIIGSGHPPVWIYALGPAGEQA